MEWTRDRPTAPGHYVHKQMGSYAQVVEVRKDTLRGRRKLIVVYNRWWTKPLSSVAGWWIGPIPAPPLR